MSPSLAQHDHALNQANKRTIYIDHAGISPVKFNLDDSEKTQLDENGKIAVQEQVPILDAFHQSRKMPIY